MGGARAKHFRQSRTGDETHADREEASVSSNDPRPLLLIVHIVQVINGAEEQTRNNKNVDDHHSEIETSLRNLSEVGVCPLLLRFTLVNITMFDM